MRTLAAMRTLVLGPPPPEVQQLLERRKRLGLDMYDEVWEGTYHMAPMARGRHGRLQAQLTRLLGPYADNAGLLDVGPFNLGDGPDNFRVPDLGYLRELDPEVLYFPTAAVVVEVVSAGDETYEKFPFYAAHEVDEMLVVHPEEHHIRTFSRAGGHYDGTGRSILLGIDATDLEAVIRWP